MYFWTHMYQADLVDPGRVDIFERWESQQSVEAFRGSGLSDEQGATMLSASVAEYDVADVSPPDLTDAAADQPQTTMARWLAQ